MIQACPHCGCGEIIQLEIGEDDIGDLYECEDCGEQFHGDEM